MNQQNQSLTERLSTLATTQIGKQRQQAETNRSRFPEVSKMVDSLTEVFGPVKVKWASEGGKEVGTRQPFDGMDVDKLIALDDWSKHARKRGKRHG